MPLLSIIIPVYNVENYIDECIGSILSQDFTDYEVILVDNASTDSSGRICEIYANKNSNIRVIHLKVNALPSGARNAGLDIARGEYVHFCDSDDYYAEDCFNKISDILHREKSEVLMGQFICIPEKGAYVCNDIQLDTTPFVQGGSSNIAEYLLSLPKLLCTPWRFIVKRELLLVNNLRFIEGYNSEDEEWFPKVICCAEMFSLLKEPFYYYRPRAVGSITSIKTYTYSKSHLVVALSLLSFIKEKNYDDARRDLVFERVRFLLGIFATRCDTFDENQMLELADYIEKNAHSFRMLKEITKPNDLYHFINRYGFREGLIEYCRRVINETLEIVRGKENFDIFIFPTGYNGEGTARILVKAGYKVKGFLDNSEIKNGCLIDDLPVSLPIKLKKLSEEDRKNSFVLVTIQQEHIAKAIMNQLRGLGLNDSQFYYRIY